MYCLRSQIGLDRPSLQNNSGALRWVASHAAAKSSVASCPAERIFVCPLDKPHLPRTSNANRIKSAVRGMPSFPLMTVHELAMVL
jgi:hypothetical protein